MDGIFFFPLPWAWSQSIAFIAKAEDHVGGEGPTLIDLQRHRPRTVGRFSVGLLNSKAKPHERIIIFWLWIFPNFSYGLWRTTDLVVYTSRIHGTGIFTYMKTIKINYSCWCKYTSPMDPVGWQGSAANSCELKRYMWYGICYIPSVPKKNNKHVFWHVLTCLWQSCPADTRNLQRNIPTNCICVFLTCWSQYAVNIEDMLYKHVAHRKRRCIVSASSNANWTSCWYHFLKFEVSTTSNTWRYTNKQRQRFPSCYHANGPKNWVLGWFPAV